MAVAATDAPVFADAVLLYAYAIERLLAAQPGLAPPLDPDTLYAVMPGMSFEGISGRVLLDGSADRVPSYIAISNAKVLYGFERLASAGADVDRTSGRRLAVTLPASEIKFRTVGAYDVASKTVTWNAALDPTAEQVVFSGGTTVVPSDTAPPSPPPPWVIPLVASVMGLGVAVCSSTSCSSCSAGGSVPRRPTSVRRRR